MNETGFPKGSALDNALWPLKYATTKKTLVDFTPQVIENASKLLADFDAAFPAIKALADLDREQRHKVSPQLQQIPRSK
jgi:hypothetical protein